MFPDRKRGFGKVSFGMCVEEVKGVLGEPKELEEASPEDGLLKTYYYDKCTLFFSDNKSEGLVELCISDGNLFLLGTNFFGKSEYNALITISKKGYGKPVQEDRVYGRYTIGMLKLRSKIYPNTFFVNLY